MQGLSLSSKMADSPSSTTTSVGEAKLQPPIRPSARRHLGLMNPARTSPTPAPCYVVIELRPREESKGGVAVRAERGGGRRSVGGGQKPYVGALEEDAREMQRERNRRGRVETRLGSGLDQPH
jgi:hypothetical protein